MQGGGGCSVSCTRRLARQGLLQHRQDEMNHLHGPLELVPAQRCHGGVEGGVEGNASERVGVELRGGPWIPGTFNTVLYFFLSPIMMTLEMPLCSM